MKYDIPTALQSLKPGAQWALRGDDYSGLEWLDSGQTKPTETEVINKIASLDAAEPMRLLRLERDKRIALTDWRASSDLTIADAWKTYRQALRDLPASASPSLDSNYELDLTSVTWPTEPS
nr:phage tail fiber assembly protein [uncultured Mediterranean phage uvMED]